MKRFSICLVFALVLLAFPARLRAASTHDFNTGQDWNEHMSPREKYMALIPPAILFSDYDVHLKLTLPQYVSLIDQVMVRNPQLQSEEVSSIFASTVYLFEPQNRPALRGMELSFLQGDYANPSPKPRLTIDEILAETPAPEN